MSTLLQKQNIRISFPPREHKEKEQHNLYNKLLKRLSPHPLKLKEDYKYYIEVQKYLYNLMRGLSRSQKKEVQEYLLILEYCIEEYEKKHYSHIGKNITGIEVLEFLMEQHNLTQSDFQNEIGSQSLVSQILSGKKNLTKGHIEALSKRFNVSPEVFFNTI
ncbi:type II toxin-antitoxin system HigA family antitoxin [Candidatus Margulisiibacteriota bacterium]